MNELEQSLISQLGTLMFLSTDDCRPHCDYNADLPCLLGGTSSAAASEDLTLTEQLKRGGLEMFGRYRPFQNKVEVDGSKCRQLASDWGIPEGEIEKIVLVHELAHCVSHKGTWFVPKREWPDFHKVNEAVLEDVAQGFTFLWIRKYDQTLMETFVRLSNSSPARYRQWTALPPDLEHAWSAMVWRLYKESSRVTEADLHFNPKDASTINGI